MQVGSKICPGKANETTKTYVEFERLFSKTPVVVASPKTSVPGNVVKGVAVGDVTTTGFNIYVHRTTATETSVQWIAMEES